MDCLSYFHMAYMNMCVSQQAIPNVWVVNIMKTLSKKLKFQASVSTSKIVKTFNKISLLFFLKKAENILNCFTIFAEYLLIKIVPLFQMFCCFYFLGI